MKQRWWIGAFGLGCLLLVALVRAPDRLPGGTVLLQRLRGKATLGDRVAQFGPTAYAHWQPYFAIKHIAYPPPQVLLVGFKREKRLEVYASSLPLNAHAASNQALTGQGFQFIRSFKVQGLSGKLGPKLRLGDMQVPEGFYRIESLNPNSAFQVALRVNYPNAFDRAQAQAEGRTELGGDIMIHGSNASAGCLAMGDAAAEDLFVLAAATGIENIQLVISPVDFRQSQLPPDAAQPLWVKRLYSQIKAALLPLPAQ